jgi:biotin carboxyl carrier protein
MKALVYMEDAHFTTELAQGGVRVDDHTIEVELATNADASPVRSIRIGGRSLRVLPRRLEDGSWELEVEGIRHRALVLDRGQDAVRKARKAAAGSGGPAPLKAPMPGLVVRVEVEVGEVVEAGAGVVIVEAMKMENELKATAPARVRAIHVAPGAAVEKDAVLVEFEPVEGPAGDEAGGDTPESAKETQA